MEAVKVFNDELSSVYETKPPISRAKMASITKSAIKAIKFYKHVVQSVEKFVQKCRPEYKVPGLYVMDSIVRQSRHQFGMEKDMFGPRFTKNVAITFHHLFKCPTEERSKIIRVLNLWQKNNVFPSGVIQPLLDLAADPFNPHTQQKVQSTIQAVTGLIPSLPQNRPQEHGSSISGASAARSSGADPATMQTDVLKAVTQLLQQSQTQSQSLSLSAQQQQLQQLQMLQQQLMQQSQMLQQPQSAQPVIDGGLLSQIQALTSQLLQRTQEQDSANPPEPATFNKNLLDFDYGESDEEEDKSNREPHGNQSSSALPRSVQNLLNDPSLMQHIQQMSETLHRTEQLKSELSAQEERQRMLEQQHNEFNQQIHKQPPLPPMMQDALNQDYRDHSQDMEDSQDGHDGSKSDSFYGRSPKRRRRSRSRSRDRRRRSRSRDRYRRSRSRDRDRDRERDKEREKERERRRKGLPLIKPEHLTVCSTTIWIGHLNKSTTEDDLQAELVKYGEVASINLIVPRGCAFVIMSERRDASKAVDRLKGMKILGNTLKSAWAPNKGIQDSNMKDYWDIDNGASYIPWSELPADLNKLTDGGFIDEDTLPEHLKKGVGEVEMVVPQDEEMKDSVEMMNAAPVVDLMAGVAAPLQPPNFPPTSLSNLVPGFPHSMAGMMMMPPPMLPHMMVPGMVPPPPMGMAPMPPMPPSGPMPPMMQMGRSMGPMMPGSIPLPTVTSAPSLIATPSTPQGDATPTFSEPMDTIASQAANLPMSVSHQMSMLNSVAGALRLGAQGHNIPGLRPPINFRMPILPPGAGLQQSANESPRPNLGMRPDVPPGPGSSTPDGSSLMSSRMDSPEGSNLVGGPRPGGPQLLGSRLDIFSPPNGRMMRPDGLGMGSRPNGPQMGPGPDGLGGFRPDVPNMGVFRPGGDGPNMGMGILNMRGPRPDGPVMGGMRPDGPNMGRMNIMDAFQKNDGPVNDNMLDRDGGLGNMGGSNVSSGGFGPNSVRPGGPNGLGMGNMNNGPQGPFNGPRMGNMGGPGMNMRGPNPGSGGPMGPGGTGPGGPAGPGMNMGGGPGGMNLGLRGMGIMNRFQGPGLLGPRMGNMRFQGPGGPNQGSPGGPGGPGGFGMRVPGFQSPGFRGPNMGMRPGFDGPRPINPDGPRGPDVFNNDSDQDGDNFRNNMFDRDNFDRGPDDNQLTPGRFGGRDHDRDFNHSFDDDRDQLFGRERDHEKDGNRDRDRDQGGHRGGDRGVGDRGGRGRDRDRGDRGDRDRDRDRDRENRENRDRKDRDRDRDRERHGRGGRDRDRDRDRDRRDRDRGDRDRDRDRDRERGPRRSRWNRFDKDEEESAPDSQDDVIITGESTSQAAKAGEGGPAPVPPPDSGTLKPVPAPNEMHAESTSALVNAPSVSPGELYEPEMPTGPELSHVAPEQTSAPKQPSEMLQEDVTPHEPQPVQVHTSIVREPSPMDRESSPVPEPINVRTPTPPMAPSPVQEITPQREPASASPYREPSPPQRDPTPPYREPSPQREPTPPQREPSPPVREPTPPMDRFAPSEVPSESAGFHESPEQPRDTVDVPVVTDQCDSQKDTSSDPQGVHDESESQDSQPMDTNESEEAE